MKEGSSDGSLTHQQPAARTRENRGRSGTGSAEQLVMCPLGCDQWISAADLDSHELMHQVGEPLRESVASRLPFRWKARWSSGSPLPLK